METIRTYLENLFSSLPQTPEVLRAKEELYTMMEDKYQELRASGKSENEAVGTVISEFGNLDELRETLGLSTSESAATSHADFTSESMDDYDSDRILTEDDLDDFLKATGKSASRVALAVMLCVFSPILLILFGGLSSLTLSAVDYEFLENAAVSVGLVGLFLLVTVAVILFISNDHKNDPYKWMKKEPFYMTIDAESYLQYRYTQFRGTYTTEISIGVALCLLSVIPMLLPALLADFDQSILPVAGICLMLFMIGIGVYLLVHGGTLEDAYKLLLQKRRSETKRKESPMVDSFLQVLNRSYWTIVTLIYLGVSFRFSNWHISWIIWVLASIIQPLFKGIVKDIRAKNQSAN